MNYNKLSEPRDYYSEDEGEVLPPEQDFDINNASREAKERGEIIARAYMEKNDELTREVFPSVDMQKAYSVSRRLLELDDHDSYALSVDDTETVQPETQPDEVKFTIVGKFGNRIRGEYDGRVLILDIPSNFDTDSGHESIKRRIEDILRNGGGRKVPKKK